MKDESDRLRHRRWKWALALAAVLIALGASEGLLRWALFDTAMPLAAKDATYYARTADELWVYRFLFSRTDQWAAVSDRSDASRESRIPFYRDWATSLMPDATLGYTRRPNVRTPCHETTSLGTRGTREYAAGGRRIVFFGDSFVESAACADDTLTTKIEALTGIDTLNYGVGGYGLDQIYLNFERVAPTLDADASLVLVGLIQNDLERILLQVRAGPKPYFTIDGDALVPHTDHIHADRLTDYFQRPPARSYLWYFLRGRFGTPVYDAYLQRTRDERREAVATLSRKIVEGFDATARKDRLKLAFVIFPTPGAPFDDGLIASMRSHGIAVIDLQGCLRQSGQPDTELYAELHPTSLGNDLLARCLVADLTASSLLRP